MANLICRHGEPPAKCALCPTEVPKAGSRQSRSVSIDRSAVDEKKRTVDLAFSSETPVVRWWGIEILSHDPGAMNMSRMENGAAFLLNHSTDRQIGVVETCSCDEDKKGRSTVRFSKSSLGQEILQDVMDGIRRLVSVGYMIDEDPTEMKPEDMSEELKNLALKEQLPVYRINAWTPYEVSMVPIPADMNVGVGRSGDRDPPSVNIHISGSVTDPDALARAITEGLKGKTGKKEEAANTEPASTTADTRPPAPKIEVGEKGNAMGEEAKVDVQEQARLTAAAVADGVEKEAKRRDDIWSLSARHGIPTFERDKALADGTSIESFRGKVLERIGPGKNLDTPIGEVGLTGAEVRKYSFLKAVRASMSKDWRGAEFERECSMEIAKKVGSEPRSFFLPYDIMTARRTAEEIRGLSRALNVTTAAEGGYLKGTQHMAGSFIELLRARLVAAQAGVGIMSGLVGNIDIPKQTGATTAYWVGEGVDITEGAPTFGQVTLSPKSIGAYVDITRRLLLQSAPAADGLVMADITRVLGLGIDKAVFHGAGTAEPTGIDITPNIGAFTGATFSRTLAISALTDVMNANADKAGMAWVTNPTGWGILKIREQGTAGYPIFLCDDQDRMLGFPVLTSTQIESANMFFGDFSQAIIGEWGVLDINVDDKSLSKSGGIRIVGFQSIDVAVRNAGAFTLTEALS